MGYDKLERNLIDIIKEEQAKLGFFKEDIRLYYPLSSLNHFFSATDTADEMQTRLNALPDSLTEKLGQINVSHKGDRFCFHIPKEGTVYVHDNTAPNEFIKSLVELVAKHGCTMNEILNLFHTYSQNIITEKMNNGEFDCLIRFADKPEDTYYYCFKDEGCHIIYHRFFFHVFKQNKQLFCCIQKFTSCWCNWRRISSRAEKIPYRSRFSPLHRIIFQILCFLFFSQNKG